MFQEMERGFSTHMEQVVKMGFDRDALLESLHNRVQNDGTVAYYLLLDNRFRNSSGYLGAEFQEPLDGFNRNESRAHPREIMTEVLKALQELNVCWKKIGHYNITDKKPAFRDYILKKNVGGDRSGR
ncbi:putative non-specific serine/threonine protein kinase [Helianthus debilis subsp. tardiflorus]